MAVKSLSQHIPKKTKHRIKPMSANTIKLYTEIERSITQGEVIKIINNNIQCNEDIEKYLRYSRAKDKAKQLREICELFFKLSKEDIVEVYNNTNPFDYIKSRACIETGKDVYMIGKASGLAKLTYKITEQDFNQTVERFKDKEAKQSENSLMRDIVRDDFKVRSNQHIQYIIVPSCNKGTCTIKVEQIEMGEQAEKGDEAV